MAKTKKKQVKVRETKFCQKEGCGMPFKANLRGVSQKFCSTKCRMQNFYKKNTMKVVCPKCDTAFEVYPTEKYSTPKVRNNSEVSND